MKKSDLEPTRDIRRRHGIPQSESLFEVDAYKNLLVDTDSLSPFRLSYSSLNKRKRGRKRIIAERE